MKQLTSKLPEFCASHWLLRLPLIIVFLQQGLAKWPITESSAEAWGLPLLVWSFVVLGELGAGLGLAVGGVLSYKPLTKEAGDLLTRFSGITIASIMTGVIWLSYPESLLEVILYDHFHFMLWVGGMYFALRGNKG